jgi:hypothetical protein
VKYLQVFTLLVLTTLVASDALAQYGLYGSPGVVTFSPERSAATLASHEADPAYTGAATSIFLSPLVHATALNPAPPPAANPAPLRGPSQPAPSVVDRMLSESSQSWPAPWGAPSGCGSFGQAVAAADVCGPCDPCFQPRWRVSLSALYMTRDDPDLLWTTFETGASANLVRTYVPMDWSGGAEIRVGRRFGCNNGCGASCTGGCGGWTLEGVFWGLDSLSGSTQTPRGTLVSSLLNFTDVSYANPALAGESPGDLFYSAELQRVSRHDEVYSVELNLIRSAPRSLACSPFRSNWSIGARLFQFDEDWRYASLDEGGFMFGVDPSIEGYLDDSITNTLVGAQIAGDFVYEVNNWRLFFRPKVGLYNNHIKNRFTAYRGDGELFDPDFAGYPGLPVESATDVVSFLTEFDAGLEWQFHPRWSTHVGYRATIVTGIGLTDHQIPHYIVDTPLMADIDHNPQLILHGGYAGVTYQF